MSRFFSSKYEKLIPYVPGEQPRDRSYIKLNTNESPFPPNPAIKEAVVKASESLQLYSDPEIKALREAIAAVYKVDPDQVLPFNGSDEALYFSMLAFCDKNTPAVFADITYGFYSVFAEFTDTPQVVIPLKDDFTIDVQDYLDVYGTVFIANPNAPTGLQLNKESIKELLKARKDNVVIIDEAYVDFGGESCVDLINDYENLIVIQTFSKSRSLASGRLGYAIGNKELIADLRNIKFSTNPFNVNNLTAAAGIAVLNDEKYTRDNCKTIMENREYTLKELRRMGFYCTDSVSNFVFASHPSISGKELYLTLKGKGILVRHFDKPRISPYIRVTIGTLDEMTAFINAVKEILALK
ncbi:MAG: histidinol-phosphate transaminase [Parasporobacterium sp.]|nr:histidinol-phosphate transaminase [Parasporobacterium sp.]